MKTLISISWGIIVLTALGMAMIIFDGEFVADDLYSIFISGFYAVFTYKAGKLIKEHERCKVGKSEEG